MPQSALKGRPPRKHTPISIPMNCNKLQHIGIGGICLSALIATEAKAAIFRENGGTVTVEAEHFESRTDASDDNHRWLIVPDEAQPGTMFLNARGGKYMQVLPDSGQNRNQPNQFFNGTYTGPSLTYKLQIGTTGMYRLYLRSVGPDGVGDTVYARIVELADGPGGANADWYRNTSSPTTGNFADINGGTGWDGTGGLESVTGEQGGVPMLFNISAAGIYTLQIDQREDGVGVDAFVLQLNSLPPPANSGPSESISPRAPSYVHYQGRVAIQGSAFSGTGNFKFAFVDTNSTGGPTTLWSHDGSSVGGGPPKSSIPISVSQGLYSIRLGDTTVSNMTVPVSPASLSGSAALRVWFNDGVHGLQQLAPDTALVSVPYAIHSLSSATPGPKGDPGPPGPPGPAAGPISRLSAPDGTPADALVVDSSGNIGIGTATPARLLDISGNGGAVELVIRDPRQIANERNWRFAVGGSLAIEAVNDSLSGGLNVINFLRNGNVGIGTTTPGAMLHVNGDLRLGTDTAGRSITSPGRLHIQSDEFLYLNPWGGGSVIVGGGGGPGQLWVTGTTITKALEIRGGADFSERFRPMNNESVIEPGHVVSYAEDGSQRIQLANEEYDTKVAGIVSGGDGISPGITLGQNGTPADGSIPVAMTGRVRCLADATYGAIKVGDLLTSSPNPGHAMKAVDKSRALGSTIGKATSNLDGGRGWIWVHVTSR